MVSTDGIGYETKFDFPATLDSFFLWVTIRLGRVDRGTQAAEGRVLGFFYDSGVLTERFGCLS